MLTQKDIDHYHEERAHEVALNSLRIIAKNKGASLNQVIKLFTNGDYETTEQFWINIITEFNGKYNRVDYCSDCQKFSLYFEED